MDRKIVTVVSGLPRSGTSMMMRMLEAGGMAILTDEIRTADADNPRGYYEFERVKQLQHDQSWLDEARGKAVKVIAALLKYLPPDYAYKVIFLRRNMDEILASQKQMLVRRGEPADAISDEKMTRLFKGHLGRVEAWLAAQPNVEVLYVDYKAVLKEPLEHAQRIGRFLGLALDAAGMACAVDKSLYRQRQ
jgi:hypothetical protein